ncbi:MAG: NAD(P)-binding protein [Anaerolineae bacterium]|nr:NAD(P)-binding protein [Anaerolineae bacterium]
MSYQLNKAVVIGAGTMGAAIAAHLANSRVQVVLLDIVPKNAGESKKRTKFDCPKRVGSGNQIPPSEFC